MPEYARIDGGHILDLLQFFIPLVFALCQVVRHLDIEIRREVGRPHCIGGLPDCRVFRLRAQVVPADQVDNLFPRVIVKFQTPENVVGHHRAGLRMSLKMIHPVNIRLPAFRFCDIVQKHREPQHRVGRDFTQGTDRMLADRVHVMFRILCGLHAPVKFRHYDGGNSQFVEIPDFFRMGRGKQLHQLDPDALGAYFFKLRRMPAHSFPCSRFYGKPKLGRKADRPHDAQGIFFKAFIGIAHAADHFPLEIPHAPVQVHQPGIRIVGHRIDRKIPPHEVVGQIRRKRDFVGMSPVRIFPVQPVCRHLKSVLFEHDRHRPVLDPGINGAPEAGLYFLRRR